MRLRIHIEDERRKSYFGEVELKPATRKDRLIESVDRQQPRLSGKKETKPSEAIARLYRAGFFGSGKSSGEVEKKLSEDGFNYSKSSTLTALRNAPYLRTTGTRGSYRFVQKYPQSR